MKNEEFEKRKIGVESAFHAYIKINMKYRKKMYDIDLTNKMQIALNAYQTCFRNFERDFPAEKNYQWKISSKGKLIQTQR